MRMPAPDESSNGSRTRPSESLLSLKLAISQSYGPDSGREQICTELLASLSLDELPSEVMHPAMDDALRQVQEYVLRANAFMTKLRTLRNSSVHVNRVPTELLAEILCHAIPPSKRSDISLLNRVTHVCRHWRTVALDAAELWGTLWIDCPSDYDAFDESDDDRDELPSFIEEYLRRSKSYPLDVTIMGLNGTRVDDCIEVLQSHQHRVRKLRIQAEDHETMRSVLPRLSYMDAPLLEDLRLGAALPSYSIVYPPLIFQPHDLFGGHFPPLHSIYLSDVSLSLSAESNILRNLQHLILTGQGISITEMDTLFDILDRCPDLKTLKLHSSGLSPSTAPQHPSRTDRVVLLPSLRVASIDWEQSMVAGWLLTHLCLPETANLNVVLSRDDHLPVRASIRTLSSIRTLRIAIEEELLIQGYAHHNKPSFIRKSLRPTKSALSLCMRFHTEEEARDHFTHFLQAHRDVSLFSAVDTLTIGRGDFYLPDHWASLFEVMPGLRMLHVCGVDKSLSSCLAALCASDTARGQSVTYVRPRLAALQILEIQGMRGLQNEDSKAALTRAVRLMSMEGALQTLRLNGRSPWHAGVDAELLRQFCTVEITEVASD